jgi:hypothetical protein
MGVLARFATVSGITRVGGYRIVDNTADVLEGCLLLPRVEVIAVASDRASALIKLL